MGLAEAAIADVATVGLLSGMHAHVNSKTGRPRKALGTHCAHVWTLTRMSFNVFIVDSGLGEGFGAH